jgi:hypothetical protein
LADACFLTAQIPFQKGIAANEGLQTPSSILQASGDGRAFAEAV